MTSVTTFLIRWRELNCLIAYNQVKSLKHMTFHKAIHRSKMKVLWNAIRVLKMPHSQGTWYLEIHIKSGIHKFIVFLSLTWRRYRTWKDFVTEKKHSVQPVDLFWLWIQASSSFWLFCGGKVSHTWEHTDHFAQNPSDSSNKYDNEILSLAKEYSESLNYAILV